MTDVAESAAILIVEDERVVAMALEEHLRGMGYAVVDVVSTGEEAIEASERLRPNLVLMDIRLAGELDGIEAAELIRRRMGIPSLFLTAYADETTFRRAKLTESYGYVIKPYETRTLQITIEMALYRSRLENDKKRALDKVKASEARFRQLAQLSPVGIFQTDAEGAYRYVNERWCAITGIDPEMAKNDGWIATLASADRQRVVGDWRRSVEEAGPFRAEYTLVHENGAVVQVFAQAQPEAGEDGTVVSYIGTLTDVTELRETQGRLRAAEERVADVAANIPGFIFRLALEPGGSLRLRYMSDGVRKVLGMEPKEVTSDEFEPLSLVEARERDSFMQALRESGDSLHTFEREFRARTANDDVKWLRGSATPKQSEKGEVVWDGVLVDVTEEKRTEAYYTAILDNSPDAILSVDANENLVLFNKGAERTFGYRVEEVLGRPFSCLFPSENLPLESETTQRELIEDLARGGEAGPPASQRPGIVGQRKDGSRFPAEAVIWRMQVDRDWVLNAIIRDITDRRELEAQYLQAQKMEALGRLAGGVAHDFNNVLAGITGHAELGKMNLSADDPLHEECEEILKGCERAVALTRQLLVFSRHQVSRPRVIDVGHVVGAMDKLMRRLIREDIELIVAPLDYPLRTLMDPGQLEQILLNLVVNARDAMPEGGRIHIDFGREAIDEEAAQSLGGIAPGSYCTIDVGDTGKGIPEAILPRIFEPFFTTKGLGEGTGLGLSTVFGIVGNAGGHVRVDSRSGKGARFRVYLPLVEASVETESSSYGEGDVRYGTERILVVEDDDAVCRATTAILKRSGYEVLSARNSGEALIVTERSSSPIDLLLTDIVLPHMGGDELADRLLERYPAMKTLFMSGYVGDPAVKAKLSQWPVAPLEKPFSMAKLTQRVREALDSARS